MCTTWGKLGWGMRLNKAHSNKMKNKLVNNKCNKTNKNGYFPFMFSKHLEPLQEFWKKTSIWIC